MLPTQPSWVRFSAFPIKKIDVNEIYQQQHYLQRVDSAKILIVDQTHPVLVSGKLVLQKDCPKQEGQLLISWFSFCIIT